MNKPVYLITPRYKTGSDRYYDLLKINIPGVKIVYLPHFFGTFPGLILFWRIFSKSFREAHVIHTNLEISLFLYSPKKFLISTFFHDIFDKDFISSMPFAKKLYHKIFTQLYLKIGLRISNRILFINQSLFLKKKILYPKKCIFIPIGIDLNEVKKVKKLFNLEKRKIILFIGKKTFRKGWDNLLNLAHLLSRENIIFYCINFQSSQNKTFISNNIIEFGNLNRKQVLNFMKNSDLLFHPSRIEGYSYTIAESLASGLPVLAREDWGNFSENPNFYTLDLDNCTPQELLGKIFHIFSVGHSATDISFLDIKRSVRSYQNLYEQFH